MPKPTITTLPRTRPDYPWQLAVQCVQAGLPEPVREYRFAAEATGGTGHDVRRRIKLAGVKDWRFDLAWPEQRIAVEVDGGGWIAGRHSRGAGMEDDCHKLSQAVAWGWRVLRVTPAQVKRGIAVRWCEGAWLMARQGVVNG